MSHMCVTTLNCTPRVLLSLELGKIDMRWGYESEWVISHIRVTYVTHMCDRFELHAKSFVVFGTWQNRHAMRLSVMSHISVKCDSFICLDRSGHTYVWHDAITCHDIWMSHVTHMCDRFCHDIRMSHFTHVNPSRCAYERVTLHIWVKCVTCICDCFDMHTYVTHMCDMCHTYV